MIATPVSLTWLTTFVGTGQKFNGMSERELKGLCKENGLSPRGSKKDMVKRLGA